MKGLVKVKGSWGMGGGLLGVASFSLSWAFCEHARGHGLRCPSIGRSCGAPSGAARSLLGSCLGLFLLCPRRCSDGCGFLFRPGA